MNSEDFENPARIVVLRLKERNRIAQQTINHYVNMHGAMDVGVGLIGLIPGAAIPALMTAIALQAPVIYQPLAKKLATIYLASPEDLGDVQDDIVTSAIVQTAGLDIAADFGGAFIMQIAGELVAEAGFGAAATVIPIVGAFVGATLDYVIATKMTKRVGAMVSIYFQNGGKWAGTKHETYEAAKSMTGGLDDIRQNMGTVRQSLLRNVRTFVEMMRQGMSTEQIRDALRAKGIPDDLIDEAL